MKEWIPLILLFGGILAWWPIYNAQLLTEYPDPPPVVVSVLQHFVDRDPQPCPALMDFARYRAAVQARAYYEYHIDIAHGGFSKNRTAFGLHYGTYGEHIYPVRDNVEAIKKEAPVHYWQLVDVPWKYYGYAVFPAPDVKIIETERFGPVSCKDLNYLSVEQRVVFIFSDVCPQNYTRVEPPSYRLPLINVTIGGLTLRLYDFRIVFRHWEVCRDAGG
ncbi:MAG: hypothetical protein QXT13_07825 [Pyrobaculum sp.]